MPPANSTLRTVDESAAKPNRSQRRHPLLPYWLKKASKTDDEDWIRERKKINKRKKKFIKKQRRIAHGYKHNHV